MNRQTPRILAALLAASLLAPAVRAEEKHLLTGNDKAVWLVRVADAGFRVVNKPSGMEWQWSGKWGPPVPRAVTAVGRNLHMVFTNGDHRRLDLEGQALAGQAPESNQWPDEPRCLALCEAREFGVVSGTPTVVAFVSRRAPEPEPAGEPETRPAAEAQPATRATTRPAPEPQTRPAEEDGIASAGGPYSPPPGVPAYVLGLFQLGAGEWVHLGDVRSPEGKPVRMSLEEVERVRTGIAGGTAYVYLPGGQVLLRSRGDGKGPWAVVPLGEDVSSALDEGELRALLGVGGQLTAVMAGAEKDGRRGLHLASYRHANNGADEGTWRISRVRRGDEPATWAADAMPLAGRLGSDQVALVWQEDGAMKLAACSLSGELTDRGAVEKLDDPPPDGTGGAIMEYFMWGVMAAILLSIFLLRPRTAAGPFLLPARRRPAHLGKRLVAGLIDLLPWSFLAVAIFRPPMPELNWDDTGEAVGTLLSQTMATPRAAYANIASMVLYVGYCIVMELKLGATVGKRLMHLATVNEEGRKPGLREAVLRNLVKVIELAWPIGLPLLLIVPVLTRARQRLGDMLARTAVIDADYLAPPPPEQEKAEDRESDEGSESDESGDIYGPDGRRRGPRDEE